VHSSSLVPANDPTLLFTNAGMNQFKDVFWGRSGGSTRGRPARRSACGRGGSITISRTSGLPGGTIRSSRCWELQLWRLLQERCDCVCVELLTSSEWFGIDPARLYCTIFEGDAAVPRDAEAYGDWLKVGVPKERIFELGAKDNFWSMGDTGRVGLAARSITTWEWRRVSSWDGWEAEGSAVW